MSQIKSRILKRGNKNEAKCIPDLPPEGARGRFWYNPATGKMQREPVNRPPKKAGYYVQTDEIPPTESMADQTRTIFTSKTKLEQYDKDRGFIHTGGDHLGQKPEQIDAEAQRAELYDDVERAHNDIKYDRIPTTEKERELCRREERAFNQQKR